MCGGTCRSSTALSGGSCLLLVPGLPTRRQELARAPRVPDSCRRSRTTMVRRRRRTRRLPPRSWGFAGGVTWSPRCKRFDPGAHHLAPARRPITLAVEAAAPTTQQPHPAAVPRLRRRRLVMMAVTMLSPCQAWKPVGQASFRGSRRDTTFCDDLMTASGTVWERGEFRVTSPAGKCHRSLLASTDRQIQQPDCAHPHHALETALRKHQSNAAPRRPESHPWREYACAATRRTCNTARQPFCRCILSKPTTPREPRAATLQAPPSALRNGTTCEPSRPQQQRRCGEWTALR